MRGEAHVQMGREIRYYRRPNIGCRARRCPAAAAEAVVLARIAEGVLPDPVIDRARVELRTRVETPEAVQTGKQRARSPCRRRRPR